MFNLCANFSESGLESGVWILDSAYRVSPQFSQNPESKQSIFTVWILDSAYLAIGYSQNPESRIRVLDSEKMTESASINPIGYSQNPESRIHPPTGGYSAPDSGRGSNPRRRRIAKPEQPTERKKMTTRMNQLLTCPRCQEDYLHQCEVSVFTDSDGCAQPRDEMRVVVSRAKIEVAANQSGNPGGRKDGLKITFRCEMCHMCIDSPEGLPDFTLGIWQDTGRTYMEWLDWNAPVTIKRE